MGLSAVNWGMFFVASVLVGKKGVVYLKRRRFFGRREGTHRVAAEREVGPRRALWRHSKSLSTTLRISGFSPYS
jgi:hypothetical protein